ncbi:hypothetical protein SAPIO_CDS5262 [Scedosporium apiospermum]|uniref:Uncharacterized protein n=1 Tax=Pseudallescheria apiosperma TaxID=563466 RepID=A0A084G676_PSEDA|nr:uncharacterized protein SAPIO_CDS5262 [Scedosporium apiospermum]KEZ42838.1 hypothetical protein SAPIO_CDS5262 [Scedosporium apiospermum]
MAPRTRLLTRPQAQEVLIGLIGRIPPHWFDNYWGKAIVGVIKAVAICGADVDIPQHSLTVDLQEKISHFLGLFYGDRQLGGLKSDTASYFRYLVNAIVVTEVTEEAISWVLPVDIDKAPGDLEAMLSKPLQLEAWPLPSKPALPENERPSPNGSRVRKHGKFLEDTVLDLLENAVRWEDFDQVAKKARTLETCLANNPPHDLEFEERQKQARERRAQKSLQLKDSFEQTSHQSEEE